MTRQYYISQIMLYGYDDTKDYDDFIVDQYDDDYDDTDDDC